MTESAMRDFLEAAHDCAMAMLGNASYVQGELPNVEIAKKLRSRIESVCSSMIGTKHDIITELSEMDELLSSDPVSPQVSVRVDRIVKWLGEDVSALHRLVTDLKTACQRDSACGSAYVLVMESATNIVSAFNRAKAAADLAKS